MKISETSQARIDRLNESVWQSRFSTSVTAEAEAEKMLKQSEKAKYRKGEADSRINLAAMAFYRSDNKAALRHLSEALKWYGNNRNEKGYVRALLIKGNIHESFGDYENTLKYWLEALNASSTANDTESKGEACSQLGLIYTRLCNFSKALDFFNRGLKIREGLNDENAVASSLNRIGMVLRQTKQYEESLSYYFRSLDIRKKNKQKTAIPWTLLGIGNTCEEMKKYPEAAGYYEEGAKGADRRCMLQCILGSGRVFSFMGEPDKAEEKLTEALGMAVGLKSFVLTADTYSALASHYERYRDFGKALKNFKKYLKARENYQSNEIQNRLSNVEIAHAVERSEQEKEIFRLKNVELKAAYNLIEEKNRDITSSISYAGRIQRALLPAVSDIPGLVKRIFLLYMPRDIVSGDFYWFADTGNHRVIVAADCTGHGVPGAFMSMLGISFLNKIVISGRVTDPGLILDRLGSEVIKSLKQKGGSEDTRDGMDISVCSIDKKTGKILFAGAYNNMCLVRDGELYEYSADRMPVGYMEENDRKFRTQEVDCRKGDMIYLFSDGYEDQFGGPEQKKFKKANLKMLFSEIHGYPLKRQRKMLEKTHLQWKGDESQTDDILIMGYRL